MREILKKICFVSVPHFIAESEEARSAGSRGPLVVASGSMARSVVLDCSPGIEGVYARKGLFLKNIRRKSGIRVIPVDYEYVEELNGRVASFLRAFSPSVESPEVGEYFIDLTGTRRLLGREIDTCGRVLAGLKDRFGLRGRCGIGRTMLVARLAAGVAGDGGAYEVPDISENIFLPPLSVTMLPDLSPATKNRLLMDFSVRSIEDLCAFSKNDLVNIFGKDGEVLFNYSRGLSRSTLIERETGREVKGERVVDGDENNDDALRRLFFDLVLELCARIRRESVVPRSARITVVYRDGYRYTTAGSLSHPSSYEEDLYRELLLHLNRGLKRRTCVKKFLLAFYRFTAPSAQLSLFSDTRRTQELTRAFDRIRDRYGRKSIGYGA